MLVGTGKRGARVVRKIGRPEVARDVIEALMLDRGLRRSFPRKVEAEAADPEVEVDAARNDLRDLATFTIDPDDAKDFDDAISAEKRDGVRAAVGAHRRRVRLRAPRRRDRHRGLPPRHQHLRAGRGGADAARGAVQPRLLAAARRGQAGRDGGDRHRRHRGPAGGVQPHDDPLGQAAHLRRRGRGVRGEGPGRGPVGRAAGRRARGVRRAGRPPQGARRAGGELAGAQLRVRLRRERDRRPPRGPDRVAHPDRGADDPRQRAGGRLPGRSQAALALPGAREARSPGRWSGWWPSSPRWTSPRRRCRRT